MTDKEEPEGRIVPLKTKMKARVATGQGAVKTPPGPTFKDYGELVKFIYAVIEDFRSRGADSRVITEVFVSKPLFRLIASSVPERKFKQIHMRFPGHDPVPIIELPEDTRLEKIQWRGPKEILEDELDENGIPVLNGEGKPVKKTVVRQVSVKKWYGATAADGNGNGEA